MCKCHEVNTTRELIHGFKCWINLAQEGVLSLTVAGIRPNSLYMTEVNYSSF